jgi:hypothetical protein
LTNIIAGYTNGVSLRNIITTLILIYTMNVGATRWSPCPHIHKRLLYIGLGDQQVAPTMFRL